VPWRTSAGVDEGVETLLHVDVLAVVDEQHLDVVDREPTRQDGEPFEQLGVGRLEQVDRPAHELGHAAVPPTASMARPLEHGHAAIEPLQQIGDRHRARPGGGDLDGQRKAVEPFAQAYDPGDVRLIGRCTGVVGTGQEQPDRR
jgi:hypothetical protein